MRQKKTIIAAFIFAFIIAIAFDFSEASGKEKATSAGIRIEAAARIDFSGGSIISSTVEAIVPQIYGIVLSPQNLYTSSPRKGAYYFSHSIENVGNGTDVVSIKALGLPDGWQARFFLGSSSGGLPEMAPTEVIKDGIKISEKGRVSFILEVVPPSGISPGEELNIKVIAESSGRDGPAYTGSNGNIYGGDDIVGSTNRILIL